ncbi:hypothetical protein ACFSHQ_18640 [Gemmobacter lanyuensis]
MPQGEASDTAAEAPLRRLCYFNAGFLWQGRVRRVLRLAGYELRAARAGDADAVVVWGRSPMPGGARLWPPRGACPFCGLRMPSCGLSAPAVRAMRRWAC